MKDGPHNIEVENTIFIVEGEPGMEFGDEI